MDKERKIIKSLPDKDTNHTSILGVKVNAITYPKTLSIIKNWIDKNQKKYICVSNVHSIMECQKDIKLLNGINNSGLITPDGMPLVWLSNLYGNKAGRVYGPVLMDKLCQFSSKNNYKVFFFGGTKGVLHKLSKKINLLYPTLDVIDYIETPKRPIPDDDNNKIIKKLNTSKAQFVFIGLGCPYQEYWMIENRKKLNANVLIGVGAAFDFLSGNVKQAPGWVQSIGFEWLFRLTQDPQRLWQRYTVTNLSFIYKVFLQLCNHFIFKDRFLFNKQFHSLL